MRAGNVRALALEGAATVDPDNLAELQRAVPGVQNLGVVLRGPDNLANVALIAELAKLREREDWHRTAASWMIYSPAPPTETISNGEQYTSWGRLLLPVATAAE